jgi:YHS domain-containing protein/glycosyltransferase involved in cell wall biosynthesis
MVSDWRVLRDDAPVRSSVAALTSRLRGEEVPFDREARAWWLEHSAREGARLEEEYDFVFAHGPEALGLLALRGARGARWVWCTDLDLSRALPDAWALVGPLLREYDAVVVPHPGFAPERIESDRLVCIAPGVDPLGLRNVGLPREVVDDVLAALGIASHQTLLVHEGSGWRGTAEVVAAVRRVRMEHSATQLALVLREEVSERDADAWRDEPGVRVFGPGDLGHVEVAALHCAARVVVAGRAAEDDFGLLAADAMWKGVPVVAPAQLPIVEHGALPWIGGTEALAEALCHLLRDKAAAARSGATGRDGVRAGLLLPRLVLDQARLMTRLARARPLAPHAPDRDPVCGMQVVEAAAHAEHEGRRYAFCSTACRHRFLEDPKRYLRRPLGPGHTPLG